MMQEYLSDRNKLWSVQTQAKNQSVHSSLDNKSLQFVIQSLELVAKACAEVTSLGDPHD